MEIMHLDLLAESKSYGKKTGSCPYSKSPLFTPPTYLKRKRWANTVWHQSLQELLEQYQRQHQTALGISDPTFEFSCAFSRLVAQQG